MSNFVESGLQHLHRGLSRHLEQHELPGLIALVACGEDIHVETLGTLAFDDPTPMRRDTIFRIASLTKPIAAVAAMILIEDCKLRLEDSVDPWLPELSNRRVLKSLSSEIDDSVPALRSITLRDLLTYRMGFGSIMARPDTYPIQKLIREYQIGGDGPPLPSPSLTTDEWLRRLGSLPLLAQPGERWMYNTSGDVLGALVSRIYGVSFGAFLQERIFGPLDMKDTAFHVPAEKLRRLPPLYFQNRQTSQLELLDDPANSAWKTAPPFESGAGGLVSTIDDCYAFNKMMLNKGQHGRKQIISRAAIELMTSDQLTPQHRVNAEIFFSGHGSWGFGLGVDIRRTEIYQSVGRFGWDGGFGTSAHVDPSNAMIGILLTQRMMDSPAAGVIYADFWTLAYAAVK